MVETVSEDVEVLAREYPNDGSQGSYPWFRCQHGVARPDYCPFCERDKKWPVRSV